MENLKAKSFDFSVSLIERFNCLRIASSLNDFSVDIFLLPLYNKNPNIIVGNFTYIADSEFERKQQYVYK